ncbi:MAG: PAS domain S-box protein [Proteobacteria bacterium]|nr:PAS domain S-box protein [Pseudomonadota bacterium]
MLSPDIAPLAFAALPIAAVLGYAVGRRVGVRRSSSPSLVPGLAAPPAPAPGAPDDAAAIEAQSLRTLNRALQDSQERYRQMVESVSSVIFRLDASGKLLFLNAAWKRLSGFDVAHSLGRPLIDFLHPDDRDTARERFAGIMRGDARACTCQLRLRTREGEMRWTELTGRIIDDESAHEPSFTGIIDDISARKVAELTLRNLNQELESRVRARTAELEASNRELEAFSYSVSHDLRAPLRAIDGFSRILEDDLADRLDDASREHLERIRKACERMANLIDALIKLATLARQPLNRETFDLSELALPIIDELRAEEPARHVEVEITRGLVVNADKVLMYTVLENLLRNAWKFTAREAVARIAFGATHEGNRVIFHVEDNGVGFDMGHAGQLFRPFQRLHKATDFPGTGIGLATVQRILERHEGSIWVDSRPGGGARFRFTLGH